MTRNQFIKALIGCSLAGIVIHNLPSFPPLTFVWFVALGSIFMDRILTMEMHNRRLTLLLKQVETSKHNSKILKYKGLYVSADTAAKHSLMFAALVAAAKHLDDEDDWILDQMKNYTEEHYDVVGFCKHVIKMVHN